LEKNPIDLLCKLFKKKTLPNQRALRKKQISKPHILKTTKKKDETDNKAELLMETLFALLFSKKIAIGHILFFFSR
jgi:cytochrome c biogenesis protein ResB